MASQSISSDYTRSASGAVAPVPLPGQCAAEITIRTRHCARHLEKPEIADFVARSVENTFPVLGIPVLAWCAMPDHLHLLISGVAPVDLPRIVYNFIKLSGQLAWRRFGIELWQWRHFRQVVDEESLETVAGIIYENPQRSGLVSPDGSYLWRGAPLIENTEHTERRCTAVC